MKIGLTVWENRISPAFDFAHLLLVMEVKNGTVTSKNYEPFHSELPFSRAAELSALGVKVLICGAVSQPLVSMIEAYGIEVFPFITGGVNQVLDAYFKGILSMSNFRMPGCKANRLEDLKMNVAEKNMMKRPYKVTERKNTAGHKGTVSKEEKKNAHI